MSSHEIRPLRRRTTAAALKAAAWAFLTEALPPDWVSQLLSPGQATGKAGDILVISPRGRCHFLFVRAPADRWWDGQGHSVPAERLTAQEVGVARRLRSAGHRAHAIHSADDLARALRAWGCPLRRPVRFPRLKPARQEPQVRTGPRRPVLHLAAWRRTVDA